MPASDTWRRTFPTADLLDVVDALADLVADRVADRLNAAAQAPTVARLAYSPA